MSNLNKFGSHVVDICVGAVVCCFDPVAGGATVASSLASLTFAEARKLSFFADKTVANASKLAIEALKNSPEFKSLKIDRLNVLLETAQTRLPPAEFRNIARITQPEDLAKVIAGQIDRTIVYDGDDASTRSAMIHILRITMQKICESTDFRQRLQELRTADTHVTVHELKDLLDDPSKVKKANRNQLEALANRFLIRDVISPTDMELLAKLEDRAADYRDLRKQVEAIDVRFAGLTTLKLAAQGALDRLDLDDAAALFACIRATQREMISETSAAQANTLLLVDRVDEARDVLLDAADAYIRQDRDEWLRLMHQAANRLHEYGSKRTGPAIQYAADIWKDRADAQNKKTEALSWASDQLNLGRALQVLNKRGDHTTANRAITAFRGALGVYTPEAQPVEWADTQNNLGNTFQTLGERGDKAALNSSLDAYRAASDVFQEHGLMFEWATTQCNLGNTFTLIGRSGDMRALQNAADANRAALRFFTKTEHPWYWAGAQDNLGSALTQLGRLGNLASLYEAVAAFEAALEIRTRDVSPVDWAQTQNNYGNLLLIIGRKINHYALHHSVLAYLAALEVRTPEKMSAAWAMTSENLALCYQSLAIAEPPHANHHLAKALAAVDDALTIYTNEDMPYFLDTAARLRDQILAAQDTL